MDGDSEPPRKKIKPYITKRERLKALQASGNSKIEEHTEEVDVKTLFLTNEEILYYENSNSGIIKSSLPRKIYCQKSISEKPVWCVRWCPKYSHLLAATCGDSLKIFDVIKDSDVKEVYEKKTESQTKCCRWSRTSRQLLTSCFDGTIKLYDFLSEGREKYSFSVRLTMLIY